MALHWRKIMIGKTSLGSKVVAPTFSVSQKTSIFDVGDSVPEKNGADLVPEKKYHKLKFPLEGTSF